MGNFFKINTQSSHKHNGSYILKNSCSRVIHGQSAAFTHGPKLLSNGYLDLRRRQTKTTATSNNTNAAETVTPAMIPG